MSVVFGLLLDIGVLWILVFRSTIIKEYKWSVSLGIVSFITVYGMLFKLMHWPGAGVMLTIGCFGISCISMLRQLLKPSKKITSLLHRGFGAIYPIGYLFRVMHWPDGLVIQLMSIIIGFAMVAIEIYFYIMETRTKNS